MFSREERYGKWRRNEALQGAGSGFEEKDRTGKSAMPRENIDHVSSVCLDQADPLPRLYSKGRILGHKRGKRNSRPNQSLVQIEGVDNQEAAKHYLGKVSHDCGCCEQAESGKEIEEKG